MSLKNNEYNTKVTSVSVTKEMQNLVEQYKLSPSEVYRVGVACKLCDLGHRPYVNELNLKRNKYVKDFFSNINTEELIKQIEDLNRSLEQIKQKLKEVSEVK